MLDIGFTKLFIIGGLALIVIGPERLPRVARTLGHLIGRLQRYVADVKADINREIEIEELKNMRESVQQTATSIESSLQAELTRTESELNAAIEAPAVSGVSPASEVSPAPAGPAQALPRGGPGGGSRRQRERSCAPSRAAADG